MAAVHVVFGLLFLIAAALVVLAFLMPTDHPKRHTAQVEQPDEASTTV